MKWVNRALFVTLLLVVVFRWLAQGDFFLPGGPGLIGEPKVHRTDENASVLIVILHGGQNDGAGMKDVVDVARASYSKADIMVPTYHASILSNVSPKKTAKDLSRKIQVLHSTRAYEKIILVGHSTGALILRKSYLVARGSASDIPGTLSNWHERVERIVLLAGMNRGWDRSRSIKFRIWGFATDLLDIGKLFRDLEKGAPFVGDLRVDWLRLGNAASAGTLSPIPPVIQIRGDLDEYINSEDDRDVSGLGKEYVYIELSKTDHTGLIDYDNERSEIIIQQETAPFGLKPIDWTRQWKADASKDTLLERRDVVRKAISSPVAALRATYGDQKKPSDVKYEVEHVVFLVHGIRSDGEWYGDFKDRFKSQYPEVVVTDPHYGRFPILPFLLLNARQDKVRLFVDWYVEAMAKYPNAKDFSFIGHSNGTYIMASALERYGALRFHHVYFTGSVVRQDFEWQNYLRDGRVVAMRNDVAGDDWIVAIFPGFYQQIRKYKIFEEFFDLGKAGFSGFNGNSTQDVQFLRGGHGAVVDCDDVKNGTPQCDALKDSVVKFIIAGTRYDAKYMPANIIDDRANPEIEQASNIAWAVWLSLFALAYALFSGARILGRVIPGASPHMVSFGFIGLVLLVMYII